jgi:hypothetical protein
MASRHRSLLIALATPMIAASAAGIAAMDTPKAGLGSCAALFRTSSGGRRYGRNDVHSGRHLYDGL